MKRKGRARLWQRAAFAALTCVFVLSASRLLSQGVYLSKYIPGNYLTDNRHRVELFNPGNRSANLEGYLLVTRDYSVRLPASVRIPPHTVFRVAKEKIDDVHLALNGTPDFLIRIRNAEHDGNYVALFDRKQQLVDAIYFSPVPNVPFLPDRDTCITFSREKIPYYLPPENKNVWSYVSVAERNSNVFLQRNNKWRLNTDADHYPSTEFRDLIVRYSEGIMTIKWKTTYEEECNFHVVERSVDQQNYEEVGRLDSKGNNKSAQQYTYYEKDLDEGMTYNYRVYVEDIFGQKIYSSIRGIKAEEGVEEFTLDTFFSDRSNRKELNLRFTSCCQTSLRLKLFDENMHEVAVLFNDIIGPDQPNLLKISAQLEPGRKYLILADTDLKRYGKEIRVPEN
ncbi:MAG: hypothetical protein AAF570_14715 [Bacteroidota bacterium]